MKELLITQMWFSISCKLKKSLLESKTIILDLEKRYEKDINFDLFKCDNTIIDAFNYYLAITKELK